MNAVTRTGDENGEDRGHVRSIGLDIMHRIKLTVCMGTDSSRRRPRATNMEPVPAQGHAPATSLCAG